jgi:membrane protease YdiL (CAAX protease family)
MGPSELNDLVPAKVDPGSTPFRITDFLLVYLVSIIVIGIGASLAAYSEREFGEFTFWLPLQGVGYAVGLVAVKLRRRTSWKAFGFPIEWKYAWGLATGVPLLIVVTIILLPLSAQLTESNNLVTNSLEDIDNIVEVVAAGLGIIIIIPIMEELIFRGLLQPALRRRLGAVGSVLGSALIFGIVHALNIDPGSTQMGLEVAATVGGIFILALFLGWAREHTGAIGLPIFIHAGWNGLVTAMLLFGPETLL